MTMMEIAFSEEIEWILELTRRQFIIQVASMTFLSVIHDT
jgi:hypothetical protein